MTLPVILAETDLVAAVPSRFAQLPFSEHLAVIGTCRSMFRPTR